MLNKKHGDAKAVHECENLLHRHLLLPAGFPAELLLASLWLISDVPVDAFPASLLLAPLLAPLLPLLALLLPPSKLGAASLGRFGSSKSVGAQSEKKVAKFFENAVLSRLTSTLPCHELSC